jgi:adenosylcobinamide kinase/adenosylcobinamide-phosphate guanylyltransferase
MRRIILVLGGARSGKSRFAEGLAAGHAGRKVYVATSELIDDETRERVERHRLQRGELWVTKEVPLDLPAALQGDEDDFVLVECLTVWINNLMYRKMDVEAESARLLRALGACRCTVAVVSNEVGWGIVPDNQLARQFRDVAGRTNQAIAQLADEVYLVAAGLPLTLKPADSKGS